MSLLRRFAFAIRAKLNALLNRTSDPTAELDYSYEQMRDELQDVTRGIADVTTQKKRLEIQNPVRTNVEKHNEQARQAVRQDRDDLAKRALEKKQAKMNQIEDLESQIANLQETQDNLVGKRAELSSRSSSSARQKRR